ncbi:MAG TPA: TAXI family TRAP transporter solute-binding subunit [Dissulfurispiraceae bacterium]|nr:TAXI family TRAP transporter solute-binding subunit [Dissulfurispiraceae bacterium]
MARQKIRQLTFSAWSALVLTVVLFVLLLAWTSYRFLDPFPPKTLIMATGTESGSYSVFGEKYRQALALDGIRVELRSTSGAVENIRLLRDRSFAVDAGFVQGTVGTIEESSNLLSLGGLAYTPLWIFYRGLEAYDELGQLRGKRLAIGPEGSAARKLSLDLLKLAGVTEQQTEFLFLPFAEAKQALHAGKVDAVLTLGSPENPLIQELLNSKGIRLMSLSQAEAYARRFPDLSHVVLPKGVIDPGASNPPSDIHLISPTTNLIIRKEVHPALVYLLLKASVAIHGGASWVNRAGEFPALSKQDDPISEQAQRFYKSGGSWLYAYLPFWAATLVERLTLILIPLGMIILPLLGIAPWIYTWRNRAKYYPWYRELRKLEKEILDAPHKDNADDYRARLDRIEDAVSNIRTSVAFYDELFILKEHIQIVRLKLDALSHISDKKS